MLQSHAVFSLRPEMENKLTLTHVTSAGCEPMDERDHRSSANVPMGMQDASFLAFKHSFIRDNIMHMTTTCIYIYTYIFLCAYYSIWYYSICIIHIYNNRCVYNTYVCICIMYIQYIYIYNFDPWTPLWNLGAFPSQLQGEEPDADASIDLGSQTPSPTFPGEGGRKGRLGRFHWKNMEKTVVKWWFHNVVNPKNKPSVQSPLMGRARFIGVNHRLLDDGKTLILGVSDFLTTRKVLQKWAPHSLKGFMDNPASSMRCVVVAAHAGCWA